jgi:hypothetical protein
VKVAPPLLLWMAYIVTQASGSGCRSCGNNINATMQQVDVLRVDCGFEKRMTYKLSDSACFIPLKL